MAFERKKKTKLNCHAKISICTLLKNKIMRVEDSQTKPLFSEEKKI